MKERPIIFSGPMVRAILSGAKTQTRRVIKPQPACTGTSNLDRFERYDEFWYPMSRGGKVGIFEPTRYRCPYGRIRNHLWVRETHVMENADVLPTDGRPYRRMEEPGEFGPYLVPHYRATEPEPHIVPLDRGNSYDDRTRWTPSIFMPRWASRITLEVTRVRVERVQNGSEVDALHDGAGPIPDRSKGESYVSQFRVLWDSINAKRGFGWDTNPWVWVVEFKRC